MGSGKRGRPKGSKNKVSKRRRRSARKVARRKRRARKPKVSEPEAQDQIMDELDAVVVTDSENEEAAQPSAVEGEANEMVEPTDSEASSKSSSELFCQCH